MRQWVQQRETWDADTLEPIGDFIDAGDRVVARFIWRTAGHGPESNFELTGVYTVRRGIVFTGVLLGSRRSPRNPGALLAGRLGVRQASYLRGRWPRSPESSRSRPPARCAGRSTTASRAGWRASDVGSVLVVPFGRRRILGVVVDVGDRERGAARAAGRAGRRARVRRSGRSWSSSGCGWRRTTARRPRAAWRWCCRRAPGRRAARRPAARPARSWSRRRSRRRAARRSRRRIAARLGPRAARGARAARATVRRRPPSWRTRAPTTRRSASLADAAARARSAGARSRAAPAGDRARRERSARRPHRRRVLTAAQERRAATRCSSRCASAATIRCCCTA